MNDPVVLGMVATGAVVVGALAFFFGRLSARGCRQKAEHWQAEQSRTEGQLREQMRTVARLRNESRSVYNLARSLPYVVRELNRWDLDPSSVPGLMIQLCDALFEPEQVLVYMVSSPGDEEAPGEVFLRAHRGLRQVPQSIKRISAGDGKIGWVASHLVEMMGDDWLNMTRTEGQSLEDNHPGLGLDMVAPLVQHKGMKEQLLGVLCIGRPAVRPRDEKLMLQVVTNLGALALMNVRNVGKLADQAHHDGLTLLLNKRRFMEQLGLMINRAEKHAQPLGVFIFDIDHFKNYNDVNGHLAGDELLKAMARGIRQSLREEDMACRYGGEEFVIAMPETDIETAHKLADRLREAIASYEFAHGEKQPGGRLTISGGVAAFPHHGTNSTELLSHADQALYQAKASGRNKVNRFHGVDIGDGIDDDQHDLYNLGER